MTRQWYNGRKQMHRSARTRLARKGPLEMNKTDRERRKRAHSVIYRGEVHRVQSHSPPKKLGRKKWEHNLERGAPLPYDPLTTAALPDRTVAVLGSRILGRRPSGRLSEGQASEHPFEQGGRALDRGNCSRRRIGGQRALP